jgi:D-alanine-D-alanine ligase
MKIENEAVDALRRGLSEVKLVVADLGVILIMGRRETTQMRGRYEGFSLAASLYGAFEVDEIIAAMRSAGLYVQYFEDELEFIAWHQRGEYDRLPRQHKLVYTFAINGTGPGRRSFIPAYCAREQIPTVNSDTYTSAIDRHKFHCNRLLHTFGLPVPRSWFFDAQTRWFQGKSPPIGALVIGKATYEDGSIGLTEATIGPFTPQLQDAFAAQSRALQQPVTVQEFITGDEIEVPVIDFEGYQVPAPVLLLNSLGKRFVNDVVSYDVSWRDDYEFTLPSELAPETIEAARTAAIGVVSALGHRGFARIDFRVTHDGRPLVIDTTAYPHLTKTNAYSFLFQNMGFTYEEMLLILLATGARRAGMI